MELILLMAGIDFNTAPVEIREKFSIMNKKTGSIAKKIKNCWNEINGCVILSTCNRTEMYISAKRYIDIKKIFLEAFNTNDDCYRDYLVLKRNGLAIRHLMEVAGGLKSQVFGEDQIISQVKEAIFSAHEEEACDSVLQTVFRIAVSSAKKVKTNVRMSGKKASVAYSAVERLKKEIGRLDGLRAIVIGNGEMGKLSASLLVREGAYVTVAVREYKKGQVLIPDGCKTVSYSERYSCIRDCDIVLSATTSPHYTVTKAELEKLDKLPEIFADMSVPRDIEPAISSLNVKIFNMDDFGTGYIDKNAVLMASEIFEEYEHKFYDWYGYRQKLLKGVSY